jgi:hypothetical protein
MKNKKKYEDLCAEKMTIDVDNQSDDNSLVIVTSQNEKSFQGQAYNLNHT